MNSITQDRRYICDMARNKKKLSNKTLGLQGRRRVYYIDLGPLNSVPTTGSINLVRLTESTIGVTEGSCPSISWHRHGRRNSGDDGERREKKEGF